MSTPATARVVIRGRRAYLYCPKGHECVSANVEGTRTGERLASGQVDAEWCGFGRCGWEFTGTVQVIQA